MSKVEVCLRCGGTNGGHYDDCPTYIARHKTPGPAMTEKSASPYPTIERLADLSRTTVGYQGPELVEEAVRCWRALTAERAKVVPEVLLYQQALSKINALWDELTAEREGRKRDRLAVEAMAYQRAAEVCGNEESERVRRMSEPLPGDDRLVQGHKAVTAGKLRDAILALIPATAAQALEEMRRDAEKLRVKNKLQRRELRRLNRYLGPYWAGFRRGSDFEAACKLRGIMNKTFGHEAVLKAEHAAIDAIQAGR